MANVCSFTGSGGGVNRFEDVLISGAAAGIAGDALTDV
jgi:hypothetical protein